MAHFAGRIAIQQRLLTPYRAAFFDLLAQACEGGLFIFSGEPRPEDDIITGARLHVAHFTPAHNLNLLKGSLYLCYQRGILGWLRDSNPDVLILEANQRYLSTFPAVRWMKSRRRPVLGWGLGLPASARNGNALLPRLFIRQFDGMLTYSRRGAAEYASLGFPAEQIFVAPNAVAPRPASPPPVRIWEIQGQPVVLFVGRLQRRKRVDALLHACASLPPEIQPRLVIVGDGPERPALQELAQMVYPAAEFPGDQRGAHLERYFSAAHLFVLPGTGGLAVQQAMAHALPVIMGEGDGTNDDLVRPANGWQLADPSALPLVLRQALADLPRLHRMGAESFRIVSEEINLERMVEVFVQAACRLSTERK